MKKINSLSIFVTLACVICLTTFSCKDAETKEEAPAVEEKARAYDISSNEDANIKLVSEFIDALITNKQDKVRSLVTDDFMDYGPSQKDSMNIDQLTYAWTAIDSLRSNQDAGVFVATALVVNEGDLAGEWVNVWGTYTAKENSSGYEYSAPWHRVFKVNDDKISFSRAWFDNLAISLDLGTVVKASKE
ncbi:MAG: nuclear transport factor 2 family protein [Flavobacteriaceae bacterium]|nr:nuclear transport factor 2 family protein [Flavobacteriaceae bacterium]